ncbi:MAG TPA: hypothetical protein VLQ45_04415 [Thermoanaerobaculia bacterium]|nr:hypothetical protein [Thermoanaerobaculia bacterium]
MTEQTIRTVAYRSGDWWIIQGLDYRFVTCTTRFEDVPGELHRWLLILAYASRKYGIEPFHGYKVAPGKFWRLFEEAAPWYPVPSFEFPPELNFSPTIELRLLA